MPAIRDEEWFYSPSFQEGIEKLQTAQNEECIRFSGLLIGQDTADADNLKQLFNAAKATGARSVCVDWFEVETEPFKEIVHMADDDTTYKLDSFHLTMIDLSDPVRLHALTEVITANKPITDLILTFCKINDQLVHMLGAALETNTQILSLNINFNLLRKPGYLKLAESLTLNHTLRYLEAKLNKADKPDLMEFMEKLQDNHTLEYVDLGQADDIDGVIQKNNIPEPEDKTKSVKLKDAPKTPENENNTQDGVVAVDPANPAPVNVPAEQEDLFSIVKNFMERNKLERKETEKVLKVGQLRDILKEEATTIRASLKHCKILMLGDKAAGKTFFAHCLVHQLFEPSKNDAGAEKKLERKLDTLSLARVTELGWTKISSFHHVDMILAKRISTLPVNIENRNKANEVCFQFPEQVVIKAKDLKAPSMLEKEDQMFLQQMDLTREENPTGAAQNPAVFTEEEENKIIANFENKMEDIIDKALRENDYPSFSIWDVDSPPGFDEIFRFFFNNHGMIYIFFSLVDVKNNPEQVIKSVLKYLKPVDIAKASGRDFTSKIFLIGTFLDVVINDGKDEGLTARVRQYDAIAIREGLDVKEGDGHLDFLIKGLEGKPNDADVVKSVKKMLLAFNVQLHNAIDNRYPEIVQNDEGNLGFFPLSNNLPKICENFKNDFDDISGINGFRRKVRALIKNDDIEVINIMKSVRDAKMIDMLLERKSKTPENTADHTPDYIVQKEFEILAESAGITSRAEIMILLRYLDVTGIVSWLSGSQTLQNVIVLNPDYVIKGLSKFYEAFSDSGAAFLDQLKHDASGTGLENDVANLIRNRVVSPDLLLEKMLYRDNHKYFKEFLKHSFHLNEINLHVLKHQFAKHNLFDTVDFDELYLVPYFDENELNTGNNINMQIFAKFQAKFIPSNGLFLKGSFERAFTSLIDSLNYTVMEEKLSTTKNTLDYSKHFAKFTFGTDIVTLAKMTGASELEKSGYLLFEFSTENAVSTFLDFIERVLRKMDGDFADGCKFDSYVLHGTKWIDFQQAKSERIQPYFTQKTSKAVHDHILANLDGI